MQPKVGIGILVVQNGKILLGKRKNSHGEGFWAPPGGHLEFGETVVNATCRELKEETNLHAENVTLGPWKEVFFPEENKHYLNLFTIVSKFSGEAQNLEPEKNEEWAWFDTADLPSPLFAPLKKITIGNSLTLFLQENLLKKPKVSYLAAPFNHPDPAVMQERFDRITEIAGKLIKEGTFVFSPITHNILIREKMDMTNWNAWGPYDLTMLSLCDQLLLTKLPGWENSKGMQAEIAFAEEKKYSYSRCKNRAIGIVAHLWHSNSQKPKLLFS